MQHRLVKRKNRWFIFEEVISMKLIIQLIHERFEYCGCQINEGIKKIQIYYCPGRF